MPMKWDYRSPLRYPGAKRIIAPHIKQWLEEYERLDCIFVEPCCGGASASLYLLEEKAVSSVILTDKDPWVASFWHMLFSETDNLLQDINDIEISVETWEALRKNPPTTVRDQALYCFFFNRTCYSGILNAGMIGGHKQISEYKIDCRFNKKELSERIKRIADKFSNRVTVLKPTSVFNLLEEAKLDKRNDRVFYIDPPYVKRGQRLYPHYFNKQAHLQLKQILMEMQEPRILSYDDHPDVLTMYYNGESFQHKSYIVWHVADRAKRGNEWIISNLPYLSLQETLPSLIPKVNSDTKALNHNDLLNQEVLT